MEVLSGRFFHELSCKGSVCVTEWCMKGGLIASRNVCDECGSEMRLKECKHLSDGYEWVCRKYGESAHVRKRSVRMGSWFSESKCEMWQILLITYYWIMEENSRLVKDCCSVSDHTVTDWMSFCREVCMEYMVHESEQLGGENVIVEIDECMFGKRKYNRGNGVNGTWVFGGLERGSKRSFFRVVENPSKEVLLDIIKTYIKPRSTVISDCWKSYDCLEDKGYRDLTINHSLHFKDPEMEAHTNFIEGSWSVIRRELPRHICKDLYPSYLVEQMFRRKFDDGNIDTLIRHFLAAVKHVYPPEQP